MSSFIIEKPEILGRPRDDVSWKAAVVIQGQLGRVTPISISNFLAEDRVLVIVSTSTLRDSYQFSIEEQRAITEGRLVFLFVPIPDPEKNPHFWATNHCNKNMQRLTSYHGVNYAHQLGIQYCLKIRHDLIMAKPNVIDFLMESITEFPVIPKPDQLHLQGRMAACGYWTLNLEPGELPVLHVCDFWRFGYTEDLVRYFDITPSSTWDGGRGCMNLESAETTFSKIWLRDMQIAGVESIPELTGRYLVMIEPYQIGQLWFRSHSIQSEIEEQRPRFRTINLQWRSYVRDLLDSK